jgi:hypothetical protein
MTTRDTEREGCGCGCAAPTARAVPAGWVSAEAADGRQIMEPIPDFEILVGPIQF